MKRLLAPALLAPMLVAVPPAHAQQAPPYYNPSQAQPYDRQMPSYDDDESGYTGGYDARSDDPRPRGAAPATTYAPPGPGYGSGYAGGPGYDGAGYGGGAYGGPGYGAPGYGAPGYGDGPDGDPGGGYGDDGAPPPPPPRGARSTRPAARSNYAARIARWRARADACEAGDMNACRGPD